MNQRVDLYWAFGLDPRQSTADLDHRLAGLLDAADPHNVQLYGQLDTARRILGDPLRRAAYDQQLANPAAPLGPWEIHQIATAPTMPPMTQANAAGNQGVPAPVAFLNRLTGTGDPVLSEKERRALERAGVREGSLQQLLLWRRTVLFVVLPLLLIVTALELYERAQSAGSGELSGIGQLLDIWVPLVGAVIVPTGVVIALVRWTEVRWSAKVLLWSWLIGTVAVLPSALVPLSWMFDFSESDLSNEQVEGALGATAPLLSLYFALNVLPIIIGMAAGALRGSRRAKYLFPAAILPGWFVVVVAPFYAVVVLSMFAVIAPVFSDGLLSTGVLLLAIGPLLSIVFWRRYTRPMVRVEVSGSLGKIALTSQLISILGVALIVIFVFAGSSYGRSIVGTQAQVEDQAAIFTYAGMVRIGAQFICQFLLTSIVCCFLFAAFVYREWQSTATMTGDVKREHDLEMQGLRHFDGSSSAGSSGGPHQAGPVAQSAASQSPHGAPAPGASQHSGPAPQQRPAPPNYQPHQQR